MVEKIKRYVAEADFYAYAETDEEAKVFVEEIAKEIRLKYDNHFKVHKLVEQPYATIGNREVEI